MSLSDSWVDTFILMRGEEVISVWLLGVVALSKAVLPVVLLLRRQPRWLEKYGNALVQLRKQHKRILIYIYKLITNIIKKLQKIYPCYFMVTNCMNSTSFSVAKCWARGKTQCLYSLPRAPGIRSTFHQICFPIHFSRPPVFPIWNHFHTRRTGVSCLR